MTKRILATSSLGLIFTLFTGSAFAETGNYWIWNSEAPSVDPVTHEPIVNKQTGEQLKGGWVPSDLISKAKDMVEREDVVMNLRAMEAMGLMKHSTPTQPWSSSYFPSPFGMIAAPYKMKGFPNYPAITMSIDFALFTKSTWGLAGPFIYSHMPRNQEDIERMPEEVLNTLSPATKYDLAIGDYDFTLTKQVLASVEQLKAYTHLRPWYGICNGWSPAALTVPRPERPFQFKAGGTGRTITFYPDDIKGLVSLLWFNSPIQGLMKMEGLKCEEGNDPVDRLGRSTRPECRDVNPAMLHIVMVNQIGIKNRGVVIDRKYRSAVANQPAFRYKYHYYRPGSPDALTFEEARVKTLEEGKVNLDHYKDPFYKFRSPRAKYIVGIDLELDYALETDFDFRLIDSIKTDKIETAHLYYELELDENDNIVGSEWQKYYNPHKHTIAGSLSFDHPDLLWSVPDVWGNPSEALWALSGVDYKLNDSPVQSWDGSTPIPTDWQQISKEAAQLTEMDNYYPNGQRMDPQPLAKIVYMLLEKSRAQSSSSDQR